MYLVKVVPLAKIIRPAPDSLIYISKVRNNYLSLVKIPLRKKQVLGIVLESSKLDKEKIILKKTVDFPLKQIQKIVNSHQVLDLKFLNLAENVSRKFALPLGAFLNILLPKEFLKDGIFWRARERIFEKRFENFEEFYRNLSYLKNKNILLAFPDSLSLTIFSQKLKEENIDHLVLLKENKKEYEENIKKIFTRKLSQPILAVGNALINPFPELEEIVIVFENSQAYQQNFRYPQIDFRIFLEEFAKTFNIPLVYVDWNPSLRFYSEKKELIQWENEFLLAKPLAKNLLSIVKNFNSSLVIVNRKNHPILKIFKNQKLERSIFYLFKENKKDFLVLENIFKKIERKVVISTEVILKPIDWKFDVSIIIEPEEILKIPQFNVSERLFRIISFAKINSKKVYFLTFWPQKLKKFTKPDYFYSSLLEERKNLHLPPFYVYVKILFKAKESEVEKKYKQINEIIKKEAFYLNLSQLEYFSNQNLAQTSLIIMPEMIYILKNLPAYCKVYFYYY